MNAGGFIQSASDSVEQVFGWTPTELFGLNMKVLIPEPRRSALDRYLDRYRNADSTKSLQRTRRFDAIRKDGTVIQIELSVSRADLPVHGMPYFIGIIRDVSQQIDIGTPTADEHTRLHNLIAEQTRALATAHLRLQLADRLASLGTLAAGLGHDMNNVLLPVRARLNALEHTGMSSAAVGHLNAVRRSVTYLQHLSDGLHFLAIDPDGPGVAADGEGQTSLSQWWSQVGSLLRKAVPKHVTVLASFPAKLPKVSIAPHWLTQALLNLIINAGESIPEGRRKGKIRLQCRVSDDGNTVRISVSDNGRGMTQAVQRRALDLFFTTKSRGMGTGLGLPLVRKVAVRAGGDIELRSQAGKGTVAILALPVRVASEKGSATSNGASRKATVTIRDHRTCALISQVLLGSGILNIITASTEPDKSDIWVTEPLRKYILLAKRWRDHHPDRTLILVGSPPKASTTAWGALHPTIIDPPDDFEAIRHAIGHAAEAHRAPKPAQERHPKGTP